MNYIKTKIILSVWLVVCISMTSLVVYGFFRLDSLENTTTTLEQDIVSEKDSIQSFDSLAKSFSNIKIDSEKVNAFFIKRDEVVNFLDTIESLASTTKTQISIQSVTDKKTASGSALISIGVSASGSYTNLHHLIRLLEELPYQTEIQNVRLTRGKMSDDKNQSNTLWSADINIVGIMF